MPTITAGNTTRTVIVERRRTATTVSSSANVAAVSDRRQVLVADDNTRVVQVSSPGARGPQGLSGDGLVPPINFAWGDASPVTIYTTAEDALIDSIQVIVETPFDGASPTLKIGTIADDDLLMPTSYVDLTTARTYEASPDVVLVQGTAVRLTVTPGAGATAGSGRILITLNPL